MALIARVQHPYIVEFKEAWVEKVSRYFTFLLSFSLSCEFEQIDKMKRFVNV